MDIFEAITKRKSIRNYLLDPVSKDLLKKVLQIAVQAPSAMNTQPWEFTVVAGDVIENIRKENIKKLRANITPEPEFDYIDWPSDSEYRNRQVALGRQLFKLMGIERGDKEKRTQWSERGFRFFDAPAAIIITADRLLTLMAPPALDIGAVMQSICLAAMHLNLGTCIENQSIMYPDVIRQYADIPESRMLITSIAIGYPDDDFPANKVESEREPVDSVTTWCGL
ncbi:MAG TPA: nitroreductase [Desulfobacteraceae bacterium]|nr:nitroreductase [Desulfobacteraceae bacterium]